MRVLAHLGSDNGREDCAWMREEARGYRVEHRRDFPVDEAFAVAEAHRRALQSSDTSDCEIRQRSERTVVTICPCNAVPRFGEAEPSSPAVAKPGRVCVKSFWSLPWGERLKDLLRPVSRPRDAWKTLREFQRLGIPSARPLAVLERQKRLSARPDFLIMENLQDARNLFEFVKGMDTRHRFQQVGRSLASLLRLLCEKKVYHPDLKPENFLVRIDNGEVRLWIIDVARVRFNSKPNQNRWVRYLAQLNSGLPDEVSRLDRMRFLRECGREQWSDAERLEIARAALEKSLQRDIKWTYEGDE